jgi:hypothetical protein
MRALAVALILASGPAGRAADLAGLGYEEYADATTGARLWLPPGYAAEIEEADNRSIPTRTSPAFCWDEGELAGLGVQVFGTVMMPAEGGKAKQFMELFEGTYEMANLVPPGERELAAERLAAFGPDARGGCVGRYEYENVDAKAYASPIYYIDAGVYVYAFVLKWPRANAAAEEAAGRMEDGFSLGPNAEPEAAPAEIPQPPPGD